MHVCPMSFLDLQVQLDPWVRKNFGSAPSWHALLGMVEEIGELAHAYLKQAQGIRGTDHELEAKQKDAVADIMIFCADFCNKKGWNMQEIIEEVLPKVLARDWTKEGAES